MPSAWQCDQMLYGWSESNAYGRRGFGVIAMSDGWRDILSAGDDVLGPLVAYPEAGRLGKHPPAHGGFGFVRGRPVIFRRVPSGADALERPGNFTVHALLPHEDVDAGAAAGVLAGDWVTSSLPRPDGPKLPIFVLPAPGPRRGSPASSPVACATVLQGLRDRRPVVLGASSEPDGRAGLCDAIRRLPGTLGGRLSFSTLEADPQRAAFDVFLAVDGWHSGPGVGTALRVSAEGTGLDERCARWGRALAASNAASLRGLPEPVTADDVGIRLEALAKLAEDPSSLGPQELISVLTSPEGQAWAGDPSAPAVVRNVVSGMDPALGPALAVAAQRRPAVTAVLKAAGWDLLSAGARNRRGAETLLLGLGESHTAIDLAKLSNLPGNRFGPQDAHRYLGLVAARGTGLVGDPLAGKVEWRADLMTAYPDLWFEALLSDAEYRGPRASRDVVDALDVLRVGAVVAAAHARGPSDEAVAGKVWRGLPSAAPDRVAFLRKVAASGDAGLGIVFEWILDQPRLDPQVRTALLEEFWPILVRELRLPRYLAEALGPAEARPVGRAALAGVLALAALVAFALGWVLG